MMAVMDVDVRPARPQDAAADLLYLSAADYYDIFAGGERRARRLLHGLFPLPGHSASWDVTWVAEIDGELAGALAGFPVVDGARAARRFLTLAGPRLPPWQWPATWRHLGAARRVSPIPPAQAWYVDALAVAPHARRLGVARALLEVAEDMARRTGATGVALDTALDNDAGRALYSGAGFTERDRVSAPDAKTAAALGGPGFVAYFKRLGDRST